MNISKQNWKELLNINDCQLKYVAYSGITQKHQFLHQCFVYKDYWWKEWIVMTSALLLLMATVWWLQAQPSHFFLWPGGGQTLHNIHVKQPHYNAHISIITIIIVMGRFSVPSQWSVCLAKGTVAQSCDSGRSQWLLNHSCRWWLIVYPLVRRPRTCKCTNGMPQPIQTSKSGGVPPGKK